MFVQLCLDRAPRAAVAGLGGLALGLGTMLAIYARVAWTIVQAACFFGFYLACCGATPCLPGRWRCGLGVWAGAGQQQGGVRGWPAGRGGVRRADRSGACTGWAAWPARRAGCCWARLPVVVMLLGYNLVRVGFAVAASGTPSAAEAAAFSEGLFFGLHGLFFSLGKSVFLYNPPLMLALAGVPFAAAARTGRDWLLGRAADRGATGADLRAPGVLERRLGLGAALPAVCWSR